MFGYRSDVDGVNLKIKIKSFSVTNLELLLIVFINAIIIYYWCYYYY